MVFKEKPIEKLYYSISEVAKMFDVNSSLIRFWEKEFEQIKPKKNSKGNRMFTPSDIENFQLIYHLVKERGFTLDGARKKLDAGKEVAVKELEMVQSLERIKDFLIDLKEKL